MQFSSFDKIFLVVQVYYPKTESTAEKFLPEQGSHNVADWQSNTRFEIEHICFDRDEAETYAFDEAELTQVNSGLFGVVEVKLENGALILPNLSAYHDCWQDFDIHSKHINTYQPCEIEE